MTQRRFCIMTVGRAGSTWLIDAIAQFPDVAVPAKNVQSEDNELFKPGLAKQYAALTGREVRRESELLEAFFSHNAQSAFAGFKSMPNRHQRLEEFVKRPDITFITLERRDLFSTVASFTMARKAGTWRRSGGVPEKTLRFTAEDQKATIFNLNYIMGCKLVLAAIPNAIGLAYEDLCMPDFASAAVDDFFGRPIRLLGAKAATRAEDYVENWDEFHDFVKRAWNDIIGKAPPNVRQVVAPVP
jgi:LPS sulfotransferase NodH